MIKELKSAATILTILLFISCKSSSIETTTEIPDPIEDPITSITVNTYTVLRAPDGITIDKHGNLYAASYRDSQVFKIDTTTKIATYMTEQSGAAGMIFDENGVLHLARYNSGDIVRVTESGEVLDTVATKILGPIAMDFDDEGNLYVNNNVGLFITVIDKEGNQKKYVEHGIYNSSSLILDDAGNVYLSSYDNGKILKIDATDQSISTFVDLSIQGVGFIIYAQDYFYVTAIKDELIYKISMDGKSEILAGTGSAGHKDGNGKSAWFNGPNGIVLSEDGKTLYVAESGGYIRTITNF